MIIHLMEKRGKRFYFLYAKIIDHNNYHIIDKYTYKNNV